MMEVFNRDQREKETLHQNLIDLTRELNNTWGLMDQLTLENKKMRNFFNVPDDFGAQVDLNDKVKIKSSNHEAQI